MLFLVKSIKINFKQKSLNQSHKFTYRFSFIICLSDFIPLKMLDHVDMKKFLTPLLVLFISKTSLFIVMISILSAKNMIGLNSLNP